MHKKDWGEVCGPFCNPETNDRALKLLNFATYNSLVLANTLGNHKPSRMWTWHSPDGIHHNRTDYILVKKRFRSGIKTARTRTFPNADVGSDHDMVMMTFQTRPNNSRKPTQPRVRFDIEQLNDHTDTGSVPGSGSMPQNEKQQEIIPASQGPDNRETG